MFGDYDEVEITLHDGVRHCSTGASLNPSQMETTISKFS